MRLATVTAVGLTVFAFSQTPAMAQAPTGSAGAVTTSTLAEACAASGTDITGATAVGYCRGFITGAGQYHQEMIAGRPPIFCLPSPSRRWKRCRSPSSAGRAPTRNTAARRRSTACSSWASETYPCPPTPAAMPAARKSNR